MAPHEVVERFNRIKNYIDHPPTYDEFLKVVTLYNQGIIEADLLVASVEPYLGSHAELYRWFKEYIDYPPRPEPTAALYGIPKPRIDLNKLQIAGSSYRKLPEKETRSVCSGRDDLCNEVLNDVYVSHPTWASEDGVFMAPKKNQYEENLHKTEEDRFSLDFNIDTNMHTIGLLEPIAKRIAKMTPEEKASFRLPPGLGGHSKTIYRRAMQKVFSGTAHEMTELLHSNPVGAVPVVLRRLKQTDLQWRETKKEWGKAWRETDAKNYYRSLDYQGQVFKSSDKKHLTQGHLVNEIQAARTERQKEAPAAAISLGEPHLSFDMPDILIHKDVGHLVMSMKSPHPTYTLQDHIKGCAILRDLVFEVFGVAIMEDLEVDQSPKPKEIEPVPRRRRTGSANNNPEPSLPKEEIPPAVATSWEQLLLDPNTSAALSFKHPAQRVMFCNKHVYAIFRIYQVCAHSFATHFRLFISGWKP